MNFLFNKFINTRNRINYLLDVNENAVKEYNKNVIQTLCIISATLMLAFLVIKIPSVNIKRLCISYGNTILIVVIIYCLCNFTIKNKYIIIEMYLLSTVFFLYGLYMGIIRLPHHTATEVIVLLCSIPVCITDKPIRLYLYVFSLALIYIGAAFAVKDYTLACMDAENVFIYTSFGLFLQNMIMLSRLESFEAQRILSVEKTTDYLTRLKNRRRLEEIIDDIEAGKIRRPSGVMMIDIDYFKIFNDTYGHKAGDICLEFLGVLFRGLESIYDIEFFRYGGEEFTAFVYNCDSNRLYNIAERLRREAAYLDMRYSKITISIGIVSCDDISINNYETWIDYADAAVYEAKKNGRNRVAVYRKS